MTNVNAPPPKDDDHRAVYHRGQEALARFRGALRVCQHRPYLEREIPRNKCSQLRAAIPDATRVLQYVGQSSVESLADLAGLLRRPHVKYEDVFVELSDVVELVELGLRRYRQRYGLDARTIGRSVITSRLPPDLTIEQDTEEDTPNG